MEVETKFGEGRVLDEEFEFSFEVEGFETAISEEGEGEVFGDGDVYAVWWMRWVEVMERQEGRGKGRKRKRGGEV